ncbi:hypothetical protein C8F01DRAFT_686927 [Mycena amicta]|nr:hypothetical protein C8F01DRAFT_686927 [Mycena amicta]
MASTWSTRAMLPPFYAMEICSSLKLLLLVGTFLILPFRRLHAPRWNQTKKKRQHLVVVVDILFVLDFQLQYFIRISFSCAPSASVTACRVATDGPTGSRQTVDALTQCASQSQGSCTKDGSSAGLCLCNQCNHDAFYPGITAERRREDAQGPDDVHASQIQEQEQKP